MVRFQRTHCEDKIDFPRIIYRLWYIRIYRNIYYKRISIERIIVFTLNRHSSIIFQCRKVELNNQRTVLLRSSCFQISVESNENCGQTNLPILLISPSPFLVILNFAHKVMAKSIVLVPPKQYLRNICYRKMGILVKICAPLFLTEKLSTDKKKIYATLNLSD